MEDEVKRGEQRRLENSGSYYMWLTKGGGRKHHMEQRAEEMRDHDEKGEVRS